MFKKNLTWNANFIMKTKNTLKKETNCKLNTAYNRMDNDVIHLSTLRQQFALTQPARPQVAVLASHIFTDRET